MNVISLKDYAKENHITYEAVRQQVIRYKKDLGEHIIQDGRQQFLDEEAVAFLDSKRQKNPVVIVQQDKNATIEALREEKENLLVQIAAQAAKLSELSEWKADNAVAIAEANQNKLLLEEAHKEKEILEGFIQDAKKEIEVLNAEKGEISAEKEKLVSEVEKERKTAQELSDELTREKTRRVSFREFWQRRKGDL